MKFFPNCSSIFISSKTFFRLLHANARDRSTEHNKRSFLRKFRSFWVPFAVKNKVKRFSLATAIVFRRRARSTFSFLLYCKRVIVLKAAGRKYFASSDSIVLADRHSQTMVPSGWSNDSLSEVRAASRDTRATTVTCSSRFHFRELCVGNFRADQLTRTKDLSRAEVKFAVKLRAACFAR